MFENYLYVSSASDTLKQHLWDVADDLACRYSLVSGDIVLDIGCNDGTLLRGFQRYGVQAVGVDPARNLAAFTAGDRIERYVGSACNCHQYLSSSAEPRRLYRGCENSAPARRYSRY
jgi:hypothetical protein